MLDTMQDTLGLVTTQILKFEKRINGKKKDSWVWGCGVASASIINDILGQTTLYILHSCFVSRQNLSSQISSINVKILSDSRRLSTGFWYSQLGLISLTLLSSRYASPSYQLYTKVPSETSTELSPLVFVGLGFRVQRLLVHWVLGVAEMELPLLQNEEAERVINPSAGSWIPL